MRRTRTAKKLAQRHDRTYFTRRNLMSKWRIILSIALPLVAVLWVSWLAFAGRQAVYSSGPLSASHALFSKQCAVCHTTTLGVFRRHVTDETCQSCHDGPMHNAKQTSSPGCAQCHTEHVGAVRLVAMPDANCTQCHAQAAPGGAVPAAFGITNFASGHPEFATDGDKANLRFNHKVHLKEKLAGPKGPVTLECSDCHRPTSEAEGPWPYARVVKGKQVAAPSDRTRTSAPMMAPVAYEKHCVACHTLQFDKQIPGEVPHAAPAEVRSFLQASVRDYARSHPEILRATSRPLPLLPGQTAGPRRAMTVEERIAEDEQLLWKKTCQQCHVIKSGTDLPVVAATQIPHHWFKKARFDHHAHNIIECSSCHSRVTTSVETSDVLIPAIDSCRTCHTGQAASTQAAESRCFECHSYHDWSKAKPTKGRFKIPELISGGTPHPPITWPKNQ